MSRQRTRRKKPRPNKGERKQYSNVFVFSPLSKCCRTSSMTFCNSKFCSWIDPTSLFNRKWTIGEISSPETTINLTFFFSSARKSVACFCYIYNFTADFQKWIYLYLSLLFKHYSTQFSPIAHKKKFKKTLPFFANLRNRLVLLPFCSDLPKQRLPKEAEAMQRNSNLDQTIAIYIEQTT